MKKNYKIAAIIPAYNEEKTIAGVLKVLKRVKEIREIIVVSDGSRDGTAEIARQLKATVLSPPKRIGKGGAVKQGVRLTDAEILLFIDADLAGVTVRQVRQVLAPVLNKRAVMTVADVIEGGLFGWLHNLTASLNLGGFRALRREVIDGLSPRAVKNYRLETALNKYCQKKGLVAVKSRLSGIKHTIKEKKRGLIIGFWQRLSMATNIFYSYIRLPAGKAGNSS